MLTYPLALATFAVESLVSSEGAWAVAVGGVVVTLLARAEALYGLWAKIRLDWYATTVAQDSVIVKELKDHITLLKSDQIALKSDMIDLRSAITYFNHEQAANLVEEEKLWGYIILLHDYADRLVVALKGHGVAVDLPPPIPERRERILAGEDFASRTKATNSRLARETAAIVPVIVLPAAASTAPDKGNT